MVRTSRYSPLDLVPVFLLVWTFWYRVTPNTWGPSPSLDTTIPTVVGGRLHELYLYHCSQDSHTPTGARILLELSV